MGRGAKQAAIGFVGVGCGLPLLSVLVYIGWAGCKGGIEGFKDGLRRHEHEAERKAEKERERRRDEEAREEEKAKDAEDEQSKKNRTRYPCPPIEWRWHDTYSKGPDSIRVALIEQKPRASDDQVRQLAQCLHVRHPKQRMRIIDDVSKYEQYKSWDSQYPDGPPNPHPWFEQHMRGSVAIPAIGGSGKWRFIDAHAMSFDLGDPP